MAWDDSSLGNREILMVEKPLGGSWSTPVDISNTPRASWSPSLAVTSDDTVHLTWLDYTPSNFTILYANKPAGGIWSSPTTIVPPGFASLPKLTADSAGGLHLVWNQISDTGQFAVGYVQRNRSGVWNTPELIPGSLGGSSPDVAVDSLGNAQVAWSGPQLFVADRLLSGRWTTPVNVSMGTAGTIEVSLAGDIQGNLHAVWYAAGRIWYADAAGTPTDTTVPVITFSISGVPSTNGWYTSPVAISWSVSDPESGIASSNGCDPTTLTQDTAGTTLTCSATNGAGLSTAQSVTIMLDTTPPGPTSMALSGGTTGAQGWYTTAPSITLASVDATSGLAAIYYQFVPHGSIGPGHPLPSSWTTYAAAVTVPGDGDWDLYAYSVDNAGNTETPVNLGEIKVDSAAPSVQCGGDDGSWHANNVTISCTAADAGSGLANPSDASFSLSTTVPTGASSANAATGSYTVCDTAGSCATAGPFSGIKVDQEPPTVTYAGNAGTYTIDQSVSITCTPADEPGGSGLASSTCQSISGPAYTFPLGTNTASATATDGAGNVGQGATSFTVQVTYGSLCTLTTSFIQSSAKYKSLPPRKQAAANALAAQLCTYLSTAKISLTPHQKAQAIAAYQALTQVLANQGWLTTSQATILATLSRSL